MTTIGSRRRRRYTAAQRQEFLTQYQRSGLSASTFARQHGLNLSTLYQWTQRRESVSPRPVPLFKEVLLPTTPTLPAWAAEIALGHELTLRLGSQISAEFIAQVLQHLRRPC